MSILVKIGIFLVVLLLIFSLIAPLLGPFFQSQVIPRFGGGAAPEVPLNGAAERMREPAAAQDYEIITLLGFDAIPAILAPEFVAPSEARQWMSPDEQVIGLSVNGDRRAYSVPTLSRHEIVNDTVGGEPVAITW